MSKYPLPRAQRLTASKVWAAEQLGKALQTANSAQRLTASKVWAELVVPLSSTIPHSAQTLDAVRR